jgi:predicted 2-oxoglutarate/Fe(II)-dependent dioxygenase YbiX/peroxiredoxin
MAEAVRALQTSDPVPWLVAEASTSPRFLLSSLGGHRILMVFLGSLGAEPVERFWRDLARLRPELDRLDVVPIGVSADPADRADERVMRYPELKVVFWDFDLAIARQFGVVGGEMPRDAPLDFEPRAFLIDGSLRLMGSIPIAATNWRAAPLLPAIRDLCRQDESWRAEMTAPVLMVPHLIQPTLADELIAAWQDDNSDSGYMRSDASGKRIGYIDYGRKRRRDHFVPHGSALYHRITDLVVRRVLPPMRHAFHYKVTRVERFAVACYDSEGGGYFKRHRDYQGPNSYRAFAMTVNLNPEAYDGGDLWFPEFGTRRYRTRAGEAIIFSGALMHEALPVTRGRRFALLSFFYGEREAAARARYNAQHGTDHETVRVSPLTEDRTAESARTRAVES